MIQKFILLLSQKGLNVQLINEFDENIQSKRTIQENVQKTRDIPLRSVLATPLFQKIE